jgi:hypothetical protein
VSFWALLPCRVVYAVRSVLVSHQLVLFSQKEGVEGEGKRTHQTAFPSINTVQLFVTSNL